MTVVHAVEELTAEQHAARGEELAAEGQWEQAYKHLRAAVRPFDHGPGAEIDRLRRDVAEAHELSRRDSLTASYNRRYLDERLGALIGETGVCIALLDVDHFKQVNDTYGHRFGDVVLQRLVVGLGAGLPEGGFCARYGGEEFALVLPGCELHAAVAACEDVRRRIDRHPWHDLEPALRVTVSVGVVRTHGPFTDVDGLISAADVLLYAAKRSGRNAVAYRDERSGLVHLAGPAGHRRAIRQVGRTETRL